MSLSDGRTRVPLGAVDTVLTELRDAIESGAAPVGSRLPSEASLAATYGVGRSAVREALRCLTTLGLAETCSGKGTFVRTDRVDADPVLDGHSVESLREARPHIEVPAARLAAERRSAEQMAELRSLLEEMVGEEDPRRWVQLDAQFHLLVAQASGNDVFAAVLGQIRDALAQQSEMVNLLPARRESSNREHAAIVDAIEGCSAHDASAAMTHHLDRVQHALEQLHARRSPRPVH